MQTCSVRFAAIMLLLGTSALAGTKTQMNIVPTPADCFVGPGFCQNVSAACGFDNSECALATVSPKSKVKIDGKLKLTASIKGVTDVAGVLMTTGPAETASDNLVLRLTLSTCGVDLAAPPLCDEPTNVYLKVVLTDGKGKLKLDLGPVFAEPPGSPFAVLGVALVVPIGGVLDCPGTNSSGDITTRLNDATCDAGIPRGIGGLLRRGSTGSVSGSHFTRS